jgi:hypothetical protein
MPHLQNKKTIYWGGLIPSQVFDDIEYQSYLKFASPHELENDIITQETLDNMGDNFSTELQHRITMNAWNTYLNYR